MIQKIIQKMIQGFIFDESLEVELGLSFASLPLESRTTSAGGANSAASIGSPEMVVKSLVVNDSPRRIEMRRGISKSATLVQASMVITVGTPFVAASEVCKTRNFPLDSSIHAAASRPSRWPLLAVSLLA